MTDNKIIIAGSGGIGLYFGGRLAQNGFNVYFIARGETKEQLKKNGLKAESINGDFQIDSVQVIDDPNTFGIANLILVCVKTHQLNDIIPQIKPMVGEETVILPLLNGVVAPTILSEALGHEKVLGGLCMLSSFKIGPNHIKHVSLDPTITFGELKRARTPRVDQIKEIFDNAGFKSIIHDNFLTPYWTKMTFISTISGIGAITRSPVGVYRSVPETRELIQQTIQEIVAVARKSGAELPDSIVETTLHTIDNLPGHTIASMHRDIANGMPSELYEQNGTVHNLGKKFGVETPVNTFIFYSLLPQELKARKKDEK